MNRPEIKIEFGARLNPYMFEEFKAFNPSLTKEVYNFLRGNGSEWKIICGFPVHIKYSNHKLEENHKLMMANLKVFENRYLPEYYLNPNNWNHE
jgi:hypothetical protein